jgi:hypothetical protein
MLGPTTTAANGNCVPRPPTAKSQADFDPKGVPIYTPPFDPSLAPPLDGEAGAYQAVRAVLHGASVILPR